MIKSLTILAATAALAAAAYVGAQPATPEGQGDRTTLAKKQRAISIRGHVQGLYPGATKKLRLKLRNRTSSPLVVRSVKAKVRKAAPGCSKGSVKIKKKKLRRRIRARKTTEIPLKVSMSPAATDACQGVKYKLRYSARAQRR